MGNPQIERFIYQRAASKQEWPFPVRNSEHAKDLLAWSNYLENHPPVSFEEYLELEGVK